MATKAEPKVEVIQLQPVNRALLQLRIEGVSPMLMHRFSEKARKELADRDQRKLKGKTKPARDTDAEFEACIYRLSDGSAGFPCSAFKAAAVRAGKLAGLKMTDARQMFWVHQDDVSDMGEMCVRIEGECRKREDFVRLNGAGADLRYRAEFSPWWAVLTIDFDADLISAESIANLFARAGMNVGIGDWRPEKGGNFGMFKIAGGAA